MTTNHPIPLANLDALAAREAAAHVPINRPWLAHLEELNLAPDDGPPPERPWPPAALRPSTLRCAACHGLLQAGDSVVRVGTRWLHAKCR